MLEVNEAAEHVGGVRARTWYYWEEGRNPIPPEVADRMNELVEARGLLIEKVKRDAQGGCLTLHYCATFEDFKAHPKTEEGRDIVDWRISQSVAAHFLAEGLADLI